MKLYTGYFVRYGVKGAVREQEKCFNGYVEAHLFAQRYLKNGGGRWAEVEKVKF